MTTPGASPSGPDLTALLTRPGESGESTLERVLPIVYDELRAMASRQLGREHGQVSLQTTGLVHEAYLKMVDRSRLTRRGRAYFFAAASRAMRQVLVDHARRRNAQKRGGDVEVVTFDDDGSVADDFAAEVLDLDRALEDLARRNPRHARVVECRFFGGLSVEETAEALDVSPRTVKYDWALARAWLYDALEGDRTAADGDAPERS